MDLVSRLKNLKIGFTEDMLNIPEIQFLEDSEISLTINRGFTELYNEKPKNPILFLGKWLKKEAKAKELEEIYQEERKQKAKLIQKTIAVAKEKEEKEKIAVQLKMKETLHLNELKTFITNCEDFWNNFNYICDELKKNIHATGVYIGLYDWKRRPVSEDDDETGHIHPSNSKVLRYIGWCNDHGFLHGKNLENNTGVTYELLLPKEVIDANQGQAQDNQNQENQGDQAQDANKPLQVIVDPNALKFKLVEDVINDPKMFYFREPRLGSYLALDISYQTSMQYNSLLSAIQANLEFHDNKEKQQQRHKEWSDQKEQIEKEIEEIKRLARKDKEKENDEEEQGGEPKEEQEPIKEEKPPQQQPKQILSPRLQPNQPGVNVEPIQDTTLIDIQNLQKMITEWTEEPVKLKDYVKEEKKLIICLDTLGQDRVFNETEIAYINTICQLIKDSIQKLEQKLLLKDRDIRMAFDKKELLNKTLDAFNDEKSEIMINAAINEHYGNEKYKEKNITDETLKAIEADVARAKFYATHTLNGGIYENLLVFDQFEFIEYSKIFQSLFYFVRTDPLLINEPETNKLDWKIAKNHWKGFFPKLKEFVPRGPKAEEIKPIYKLNKIKANLESEIAKRDVMLEYSFSLLQLVDYVLFLIKIRHDDIVQRSTYVYEKKEEREKIILMNTEIEAEREKLKEQANNLPLGENGEPIEFNLEEALQAYDQEHPLIEVPADIEYDLDLDYDMK